MYSISIDGIRNDNKKIYVIKRPSIPMAERNIEFKDIPGRNGSLTRDLGTYKDLEFSVEFNFLEDNSAEWMKHYREIKNWVSTFGGKKLKLSDDPNFFYKIKTAKISTSERVSRLFGKITIDFRTDPFTYVEGSDLFVTAENKIYNPYYYAEPVYKIKGEGLCTLNVNGNVMKANVGQEIIIDIERRLAYRNSTMQNISVTGNYDKMRLQTGVNTISVTSGFELLIKTNLRSL